MDWSVILHVSMCTDRLQLLRKRVNSTCRESGYNGKHVLTFLHPNAVRREIRHRLLDCGRGTSAGGW
jgi:hypothetical protein